MNAAIALLGGIRATIFFVVGVVLAIGLGVQSWRLDTRTDQRDALQKTVGLWEQANSSNLQAIADLKLANKAWADLARENKNKAAAAAKTVVAERAALAAEQEQRRRERGKLYEQDPSAAAWGRTRVPAAIADSLRK